jgi:hypothetical protein
MSIMYDIIISLEKKIAAGNKLFAEDYFFIISPDFFKDF